MFNRRFFLILTINKVACYYENNTQMLCFMLILIIIFVNG